MTSIEFFLLHFDVIEFARFVGADFREVIKRVSRRRGGSFSCCSLLIKVMAAVKDIHDAVGCVFVSSEASFFQLTKFPVKGNEVIKGFTERKLGKLHSVSKFILHSNN